VADGSTIPYAPATTNYHYEFELAVVIGTPAFRVSKEAALNHVYGYACALDMTRRDLQLAKRAKQLPWDIGKDIEFSAPISAVVPAAKFGTPKAQRIEMRQNGVTKQDSTLGHLIWSVPEIISHLSTMYHLRPGDVILTGTPAGVGAVQPGDVLEGTIEGAGSLKITIGAKE
jgi:fumarylpyruvate hydrolase